MTNKRAEADRKRADTARKRQEFKEKLRTISFARVKGGNRT